MKIHCAEYERARERKRKFTQINIKIKVKHIIYYSIRLWNRQQQRAFHSWEFYLAIKLKFLIMAKKKRLKTYGILRFHILFKIQKVYSFLIMHIVIIVGLLISLLPDTHSSSMYGCD